MDGTHSTIHSPVLGTAAVQGPSTVLAITDTDLLRTGCHLLFPPVWRLPPRWFYVRCPGIQINVDLMTIVPLLTGSRFLGIYCFSGSCLVWSGLVCWPPLCVDRGPVSSMAGLTKCRDIGHRDRGNNLNSPPSTSKQHGVRSSAKAVKRVSGAKLRLNDAETAVCQSVSQSVSQSLSHVARHRGGLEKGAEGKNNNNNTESRRMRHLPFSRVRIRSQVVFQIQRPEAFGTGVGTESPGLSSLVRSLKRSDLHCLAAWPRLDLHYPWDAPTSLTA